MTDDMTHADEVPETAATDTTLDGAPETVATETTMDDAPELAYSLELPPDPTVEEGHWRRAAFLATAIVAVAGAAAAIIGFGGVSIRHRGTASALELTAPNGYYEFTTDAGRAKFENSESGSWGLDVPVKKLFKSSCDAANCTMTMTSRLYIAPTPITFTLREQDGELLSDDADFMPCWGGKGSMHLTLKQVGDTFTGIETVVTNSGCKVVPGKSAKATFPFTLYPAAPYEPLPIPVSAMLNGRYQATFFNSQVTFAGNDKMNWGIGPSDEVGDINWSTSCDNDSCTAVSSPPSGGDDGSPPKSATVKWANGSWVGGPPDDFTQSGGIPVHRTWTLTPDGNGAFHGFVSYTVASGPTAGASATMPMRLDWDS